MRASRAWISSMTASSSTSGARSSGSMPAWRMSMSRAGEVEARHTRMPSSVRSVADEVGDP